MLWRGITAGGETLQVALGKEQTRQRCRMDEAEARKDLAQKVWSVRPFPAVGPGSVSGALLCRNGFTCPARGIMI